MENCGWEAFKSCLNKINVFYRKCSVPTFACFGFDFALVSIASAVCAKNNVQSETKIMIGHYFFFCFGEVHRSLCLIARNTHGRCSLFFFFSF